MILLGHMRMWLLEMWAFVQQHSYFIDHETGCYQYMILFKSNYNIKEPRTTNCDSIQDIHVSSVHEAAGTLYTCITGPM
jgi:hypothetical protein